MANDKYFHNAALNDFDEIWRLNAALEKRVSDLERAVANQDTPPPLPRINPDYYGDGYEGQRAIDVTDEQHTWFSDGQWRKAGGAAIYEIKIIEDNQVFEVGDKAFEWEIPEDLDDATLVNVEIFVTTVGSGLTQVQLNNVTTGHDMLATKVSIDSGELNSKDAATPAVIDQTYATVSWGDHLRVDIDAAGGGTAKGLGLSAVFAPSALASVILEGAKGDPGGVTNWTGAWDSGTTYIVGEAVSHNGSSYVASQGSTNVEPGVDANWQDYWMLIAQTIVWRGSWNSATTYQVSDAVTNGSSSYVAIASSTDVEPGIDSGWESYWQLLAQGTVYKEIEILVFQSLAPVGGGDGRCNYVISALFNAKNLVRAEGAVVTPSSSGAIQVQIRNVTQSVDMLSSLITIDQGEYSSYTASVPSAVNGANADVATGDILAIDVDSPGTGATGLIIILTFSG